MRAARAGHTAHILPDRAGCTCGRMTVLVRKPNETVGAFTKLAYERWLIHKADGDADGQQTSMFAMAEPKPQDTAEFTLE